MTELVIQPLGDEAEARLRPTDVRQRTLDHARKGHGEMLMRKTRGPWNAFRREAHAESAA